MQKKKEVLITDIDAKNMVPLFSADNEHFDSVLSTSSQQDEIGVNVKIIFSPIQFQVFKILQLNHTSCTSYKLITPPICTITIFQIHYRATSIFFLNFDTIIFQSIFNKLKAHPSLPSLLHLNYLQVVQMKHDTNCCIRSALFTNKHLNTCMLSGRRLVIAAALPASVTRRNTCLSFTVSPDLCYCLP